ncbi:unnamed protein product, partial [Meganyctiphanes norvegica]
DWSSERNACIKGRNNDVLDRIYSIADCRSLCEDETYYTCRSIEYHKRSYRCVLSTATSSSSSYKRPCFNGGWTFQEINGGNLQAAARSSNTCRTRTVTSTETLKEVKTDTRTLTEVITDTVTLTGHLTDSVTVAYTDWVTLTVTKTAVVTDTIKVTPATPPPASTVK